MMWAASSLIWGRIPISALGINMAKNLLGTLVLLVHLGVVAMFTHETWLATSAQAWGWLSLSGLIGVVLGDTCYFRSLQIMGPRRTLMVASTAPIFAALLGWLALSEYLSTAAIFGVFLTIAGVVFVIADRSTRRDEPGLMPGRLSTGIILGALGAIFQAVGGVFAKLGMEDCSPLQATFIRILTSAIVTLLLVGMQGKLKRLTGQILEPVNFRMILPATLIGTWLGIWFSQIAFKGTEVAIATTLLATSPLFAIPMVYVLHRQRTTWWTLVGTIIGLVGIYVVVKFKTTLG